MNPASAIFAGARQAVHDAAPWLAKLARLGFAAKALLYITVGALATYAALGLGGTAAPGKHAALFTLLEAPLGRGLMGIIAVGLFGYAAWRIVEALFDPERRGHGIKGLALRIRSAVSGAIHVMIGITTAKLALGHFAIGAEGKEARHWAARALSTSGGQTALWIVALGLVAYGVYQLYCAWRSKLSDKLSLDRLRPQTARLVVAVSRFGIAARGVVFIAMGGIIARVVREHDAKEAGGLQASLQELTGLGRWPYLFVAAGLIAYGIYELIEAKYRRINAG